MAKPVENVAALARLAAAFEPELAKIFLDAVKETADETSLAAIERSLRVGDLRGALDAVPTADLETELRGELAEKIRSVTEKAAEKAPLPKVLEIDLRFDITNPAVFDYIRTATLTASLNIRRETEEAIREFIRRSFAEGIHPRDIAREMRGIVGLTANQVSAILNYRRYVERLAARGTERLSKTAEEKLLRSWGMRLDRVGVIARRGLTAERIDELVRGYAKRLLAERAETIARTLVIDASSAGLDMRWKEAIREGLLDPFDWLVRWIAAKDERVCPICEGLHGQTRPLDGTYGGGVARPPAHPRCRCSEGLQRVRRAGRRAA